MVEPTAQLHPVGPCAACRLAENFLRSSLAQLLPLRVNALAVRRYPCIAVNHGSTMHRIYATKRAFKIKAVFLVHNSRIPHRAGSACAAFVFCSCVTLPFGSPRKGRTTPEIGLLGPGSLTVCNAPPIADFAGWTAQGAHRARAPLPKREQTVLTIPVGLNQKKL
jgi:hypothetical protein